MKAALLTAGREARPLDPTRPKTLVEVGGVAILRRAITNLRRAGVDQFVIATGHEAAQVEAAVASWFPGLDVVLVDNPAFATTGNAHTLLQLRPHLDREPFFLVDGDVVFDREAIELLLARGPDTLAVRTLDSIGLEDVKVTADPADRILAIGKHVPVRGAMGESVGIQLFSAAMARRLFATLEDRVVRRGLATEYYEAALQELVDQGECLYGVDLGHVYAAELDTVEDLRAADRRHADLAFDVGSPFRLAV